jgi:hypothetical protein
MRLLAVLSALLSIALTVEGFDFKCNELLQPENGNSVRTFEYLNPRTNLRGVVCVSALNGGETLLMYMEEETASTISTSNNVKIHKQAIGRAQQQNSSQQQQYKGIIHVVKNVSDRNEDLYDLDNSHFSISFSGDMAKFAMKSVHSGDELVYLWQPRPNGVPRWQIHMQIPNHCAPSIKKTLILRDPINTNHKHGIVCVLQEKANLIKFYSFGWKRAGVAGRPRKFIHFGSLRLASQNFANVLTGNVHAMDFPAISDLPLHELDRQQYKQDMKISAVKSVNSPNLLLYGDVQEEWINPIQSKPHFPSKYPIIPLNPNSNANNQELKNIYGFARL